MNPNYKKIISEILIETTGNDSHCGKTADFIDFLLLKNSELNLISRKLSIEDVIRDHLYDSLVAASFFKPYSSITDIGSGGGFPALVLAVIFPEKKFTLIEKSPKKCFFLKEASSYLKLENVLIKNELLEKCSIDAEAVTCRAFKEIKEIFDMTKNFFMNKGKYILYKARIDKINEELKDAEKRYQFLKEVRKIESIKEKERHIVILQKK